MTRQVEEKERSQRVLQAKQETKRHIFFLFSVYFDDIFMLVLLLFFFEKILRNERTKLASEEMWGFLF